MSKAELQAAVVVLKRQLGEAETALAAFIAAPENNVFDTLQEAADTIQDRLESQAGNDCEGRGNRGQEVYEQEFIVDGMHYLGKLECEYNRHDKTYYYLEESEFTYEPIDRDGA